jgi:hypothetical protein
LIKTTGDAQPIVHSEEEVDNSCNQRGTLPLNIRSSPILNSHSGSHQHSNFMQRVESNYDDNYFSLESLLGITKIDQKYRKRKSGCASSIK